MINWKTGVLGLTMAAMPAFVMAATPVKPAPKAAVQPAKKPAAPAELSETDVAVAIVQASGALQTNDCKSALEPLKGLWGNAYLEKSDPVLAAQFRFQRIVCVAQEEGVPAALVLSTENIANSHDITAYDLHALLQLMSEQPGAAAVTLQTAMARFPDAATDLTDTTVLGTIVSLSTKDGRQGLSLMNRLEEAHWQVHKLWARPLIALIRLEGLREAVAANDTAHADLYRADIQTDSLTYIQSQGDGRISRADVPALPVRPIMAAEIEALKTSIARNPTDLLGLKYLLTLEQAAGQNDLALTQLNGILDLIDQYGLDKFEDPQAYPSLLATKAELLGNLGRGADALTAYTQGIAKVGPAFNSPIVLSYLNYLTDSGDEAQALAQEAKFLPGLPDDERLELTMYDACARAYAHDTSGYTSDIAALATAGHLIQIKPLLCAGNSDAAASVLIAAMQSPQEHDATISFMQDTLPPIPVSLRDKAYVDRLVALKSRPDVRAAATAANIIVRHWDVRF